MARSRMGKNLKPCWHEFRMQMASKCVNMTVKSLSQQHDHYHKADSRLVSSQWETIQSSAVSHWLGANLESTLLSTEESRSHSSPHSPAPRDVEDHCRMTSPAISLLFLWPSLGPSSVGDSGFLEESSLFDLFLEDLLSFLLSFFFNFSVFVPFFASLPVFEEDLLFSLKHQDRCLLTPSPWFNYVSKSVTVSHCKQNSSEPWQTIIRPSEVCFNIKMIWNAAY